MGQDFQAPEIDAGEVVQQAEQETREAEQKKKEGVSAVQDQNTLGNEEMLERCGLRNPPRPAADPSTPATETPGPSADDPVKAPTEPHLEVRVGGEPSEAEKNLRASNDPKDKRLIASLDRARAAYGDMVANDEARIIVTRSEGNGGMPVVMVVPKGHKPEEQTEVHTHYHGIKQTNTEGDDHDAGLKTRIRDMQRENKQVVFVLPESEDGRGASWKNVKSITQTTDDALRHINVSEKKINDPCDPNAAYRVVSAHSGGGEALRTAIDADPRDPTGSRLRANELHLRDCLYGDTENAITRWAQTSNGKSVNQVAYIRGTNTSDGSKLRAAFPQGEGEPDRYRQVQVPSIMGAKDKRNPHDRTNHVLWRPTSDGRGECVDNSRGSQYFGNADFKYVEAPPRKEEDAVPRKGR